MDRCVLYFIFTTLYVCISWDKFCQGKTTIIAMLSSFFPCSKNNNIFLIIMCIKYMSTVIFTFGGLGALFKTFQLLLSSSSSSNRSTSQLPLRLSTTSLTTPPPQKQTAEKSLHSSTSFQSSPSPPRQPLCLAQSKNTRPTKRRKNSQFIIFVSPTAMNTCTFISFHPSHNNSTEGEKKTELSNHHPYNLGSSPSPQLPPRPLLSPPFQLPPTSKQRESIMCRGNMVRVGKIYLFFHWGYK
ncbi:hypothetical protein QBC41DRAFT_19544 [Cercophora samala]|uniref:Uncharacterized protein n=1 Tax=Cercophora samala TaxID=330535 RepID=A0AA39ZK52_9PEZI|nr:hypothetical protein QBC41DRAFT_19544 [Cercophora samala]